MYNNELIAEFMNLKSKKSWATLWMPSDDLNNLNHIIHNEMEDETWFVTSLRFDESWDWLMPVLEKIMDVCFNDENDLDVEEFYKIRDCIPDINQTYKSIVVFIKKYNEKPN